MELRPLSVRFDEALVMASSLRRGQMRKASGVPYKGSGVWERFRVTRERTMWYYETMLEVFERGFSPVLYDTLSDCVKRMRELN